MKMDRYQLGRIAEYIDAVLDTSDAFVFDVRLSKTKSIVINDEEGE